MTTRHECALARNRVIVDLLAETPTIPTLTAAKRLAAQHPELFATSESARDAIRKRTGCHGVEARLNFKKAGWEHCFREPFSGAAIPIPTPFWDSTPVVWDSERCLILADIHIPFHEPAAVKLAVEYGKRHGCVDVLIDGDLLDHYQESYFTRQPDVGTLTQELGDCRQFLAYLRGRFPKGRIMWKEGNHEERFAHLVHGRLPEVGKLLDQFTYGSIGCADLGVEVIRDRRRIDMGYLTVIHGHELGRGTSNLVNAARTLQLRAKDCALCGHWHTPAQHRVRTIRQHHIGTWGVGCLCHLSPLYRPVNDWELGFAVYRRTDGEGNFVVDNKTIINGMVV